MPAWLVFCLVCRIGALAASLALLLRTRSWTAYVLILAITVAVIRLQQGTEATSGQEIFTLVSVSLLCVLGVIAAFWTLRRQEEREEELRLEGEARLRRLVDSANEGL